MNLQELAELYYITHIENVPSIMVAGILSHERAEKVSHKTIANPEVLKRRAQKAIQGGLRLDRYANLYICARNPMLFCLQSRFLEVCVLRVSKNVVHENGVVISDVNAARGYARFGRAPDGLKLVDKKLTFAQYWVDSAYDEVEQYKRKGAKCAEVLVPHRVDPKFIVGAYVACREAEDRFKEHCEQVPVTVNRPMFFL
jgi:hypothetical protein